MEYPYTIVSCTSEDGESTSSVTVQISESGIAIDEAELTQVIRSHLAGLPRVTMTLATRYSVAQESIPEV
ncbi:MULTISPECIES: hypothetical protein [Streptomyces]|uniref:hypothetical protein n=1 Tax=Streptomyces TaxID=1883 RepID=UPI000F799F2D|nr:hypothetical protein [Streptomyces sp. WAC05858]RSS45466.1 hypothetical protein EF902_14245 [Streptomyces sp. WAC05858]WTA79176.1 hypothetical protein OG751_03870 [Streptomyces antimycoticus]